MKVASRMKVHRFAADSLETTWSDLVLTGRSAAETIDGNLAPQRRALEGYLRQGTLNDFALKHLLVPDARGDVTIYEHPDDVKFDDRFAPVAVVAADLTRSLATRERSAGLRVLEDVRKQWLANHTS